MDRFMFLDFDGVLNSDAHQRRLREQKLPWHDGYGPVFDPEAVRNLDSILHEVPDARIVICSTWKDTLGIADLKMMWTERNLPGEVYSTTVSLLHDQLIFEDLSDPAAFAKMEGECKGREILSWLACYEEMDAPYVVIDDAVGFPPELQQHHVRTYPNTGLTNFDADEAVQILNGRLL